MKKFCWLSKDYHNNGINELAKRLTEYQTADLLGSGYTDILYSDVPIDPAIKQETIGKLLLDYTVADSHIVNDIFNFNLYFTKNTESQIDCGSHRGSFDCLVSLASGNMIETNPIDVGLTTHNHYVIDISPTAIHKSALIYKEISEFTQLDIFNITAVKEFLSTCHGTKGFFVVSNCFCYIVSSLIHDVKLRLEMQNKFIDILANDKIDWYVKMLSADGKFYECIQAKKIVNQQLDERFKVLPWIQ